MEMDGIASTKPNVLEESSLRSQDERSVAVDKPIPYTFDLGNLLCNDANPVPPRPTDADIASISRDCAQALINQLLTTCTVTNTSEGTIMKLPPPTTLLPREKPLPAEKLETKWERFAKKKGIKKKSKDEPRKVYDEERGDWVPKWGYRGKAKAADEDWIVEVDEKKDGQIKEGETVRGIGRRERVENAKRNERKQRANERKARKTRLEK